MSLNHAQSFLAGYLPALSGAYFNLTELFAQHSESQLTALRDLIHAEVPRLRETGQAVVVNIRGAQALAVQAGFEPPAPPKIPKDYYGWFDEIHAGFYKRYTLHDAAEICFRTGHYAGNILCAWNILTVTLRLLAAVTDTTASATKTLREQAGRLLAELRDTLDDLRITAKNPNGPDALWALAQTITDAVDYANIARKLIFNKEGDLNSDQLLPMAELLQQQMGKIADKAGGMDAALA
jgi:hypothetical protein